MTESFLKEIEECTTIEKLNELIESKKDNASFLHIIKCSILTTIKKLDVDEFKNQLLLLVWKIDNYL